MSGSDERRLAWIALGALIEPGNREVGTLVRRVGPIHALGLVCSSAVSPNLTDVVATRLGEVPTMTGARAYAERLTERAARLGSRIVCPDDDEWPDRLDDLVRISRDTGATVDRDADPPLTLWVRGRHNLRLSLERCVAVVGARAATEYGEHVAGNLAHGLAEHGWSVLSGGALGIDATAHRAAMLGGGHTIAVLACGIDRPYPVSHTSLFERIGEEGLLITEWPPGAPPFRVRFLIRNRFIAAASAGTVMVEAARRSGARQTLRRARELGRPALVVPGPVTSAMSVGCHEELRQEGTHLVTSVAEVLEEVGRIGVDLAPVRRGPHHPYDDLDPLTAQVLEGVPRRGPQTAEEIAAVAGVNGRDARRALPMLVAMGHVVVVENGYRLSPGGGAHARDHL